VSNGAGSTSVPALKPASARLLLDHPVRLAFGVLAVVTLFRLWYSTRIELVPDEAYYWLWSKNLAASYRDKGPAVAWVISLGTRLFGDTVFGLRFFAIILSSATLWQLFRLAQRLYDDRTALWCLALGIVIPMFAVGSILMTIDPLSVFCWAWAVNLFWTALDSHKLWHWAGLGFVIGLGFLAKFTNGVQLACIGLFLCWSRPHRALLISRQTIAMSLAFVVAILPVLYWNFQTGWVHAQALHSRSGVRSSFQIHPMELLQFLGGEAGVLSPLIALGLAAALAGMLWKHHRELRVQFLLCQSLPIFALFTFFSLNKAGKENWPAPGLIAGMVLTVVFWREVTARAPRWRWAVGAALGLASLMTLVLHNTDPLRLPAKLEPLRRAQGWSDFGVHVQRAREQHGATVLIGNHYGTASMMAYYLPDRPTTYLQPDDYGKNQFTLWPGYDAVTNTRALFVTYSERPVPPTVQRDFPKVELVDDFWSQHRGRPMTRFRIYLCQRN